MTHTRIALLLATGVAALAPAAASQAAVKTTKTSATPARVTIAPKQLPTALVAGSAGHTHYGDATCQGLADRFVEEAKTYHGRKAAGDPDADIYLDYAADTLNELEDNCMIIEA